MKKKNREIEKEYPRKQFIAKLKRLIIALESEESFRIQVGAEKLYVPGDSTVNVEHERDGKSEELEFQIKWKRK
jgi:amphi-Trp domain-containing protein